MKWVIWKRTPLYLLNRKSNFHNFLSFHCLFILFLSICRMYFKDLQKKVFEARQRGFSWSQLERNFGIAKTSCRDLVKNYGTPIKPRPKNHCKVKGNVKKRLQIARKAMTDGNERITSSKLLSKSNVNLSVSTVQRFLTSEGLNYIDPEVDIVLSALHKSQRHEICKRWLIAGTANENIIFTDKVRFNLDSPDHMK